MNRKVTVVGGAGNVGATVARVVAQKELADVVIVDIAESKAAGVALDIYQSCATDGSAARVEGVGTDGFAASAGSDVVVITSGVPRKPGMSRDDLLAVNYKIMQDVTAKIVEFSPDCIIVPVADVTAFVLGGHGDTMVPLPRLSTVAGIPLTELVKMGTLSQERLDAICTRTANGGAELTKLIGTSAWYAPGAAAALMVEAILKDQKKIMPCSVFLQGEYGVNDLFVGVPVKLGARGVEQIIQIELTEAEKAALHKSAGSVKELVDVIKV
jgi:malate dehydrogenase